MPTLDAKYRFEYGYLAQFISKPLRGHFLDARNEEFGQPVRTGTDPRRVYLEMEREFQNACTLFGTPGFDVE
jgi:hypothetical protein